LAYIFGLNQKRLIRTNNLSVKYGNVDIKFPNINLDYGGQLLIIGKSGSGKTSLLNILGGLLAPETGNVLVNDVDLSTLSNNKRDNYRGQQIGFVFQTPHFIKSLCVYDNLKFSQYMSSKVNQPKINMFLKKLVRIETIESVKGFSDRAAYFSVSDIDFSLVIDESIDLSMELVRIEKEEEKISNDIYSLKKKIYYIFLF
jgi:ABC-type sugar transport system ATPase subunit